MPDADAAYETAMADFITILPKLVPALQTAALEVINEENEARVIPLRAVLPTILNIFGEHGGVAFDGLLAGQDLENVFDLLPPQRK